MITITHLSGPLAGQSRTFDDSKGKIEFGRESGCDVVYPEETDIVGHRHCALKFEDGDWLLHLHESSRGMPHVVFVNGTPGDTGQAINPNSVLHLGRKDGPGFSFKFDPVGLEESMLRTRVEAKVSSTRDLYRRLAVTGGVIATLLIVVIGGWIAKNIADEKQNAAIFASLAKDQQNAAAAIANMRTAAVASFSPSLIDHMVHATFLVYKQDAQGRQFADGTAWVIGPDLLATNAHIAALCSDFQPGDDKLASCDQLDAGQKLYVRQPGAGGASYEVIGHSFHPGYVAFPRFVLAKDPVISTFAGPRQVGTDGYDVGLLRIKGQFPADLALKVASKEELMELKQGTPLASAGYPSENIFNSEVLTVAATPQVHYGNISALTDSLFLPTDAAHNFLIQNSIPMTGGSSGSPVINTAGHVVALLNSANFGPAAGGWSRGAPSGAEINYAQRADFVADLLAGTAQDVFANDLTYWAGQIAKFQRGIDLMSKTLVDQATQGSKATAQLASETHGKLVADDMRIDSKTNRKERIKIEKINFSAGVHYLILIYAENDAAVSLYLKDASNQTIANNTNAGWYPSVSFSPAANGTGSILIVGPDADTAYTTRIYSWQASGS